MNKELVLPAFDVMSFNLTNLRDASFSCKQDMTKHYLGAFVVTTTLLMTKYFPYNHIDAINTIEEKSIRKCTPH